MSRSDPLRVDDCLGQVVETIVNLSLASAETDHKLQFERHGYVAADRVVMP